VPARVGPWRRS